MEQKHPEKRLILWRMQMKCRSARKMMSALIDGELSPVEKESLTRHIQDCGDCRKLHQEMLAIHNLFTAAEQHKAPLGLFQKGYGRTQNRKGILQDLAGPDSSLFKIGGDRFCDCHCNCRDHIREYFNDERPQFGKTAGDRIVFFSGCLRSGAAGLTGRSLYQFYGGSQ